MARKSRMQNAREAKDKRMKFVAAGGAVLLVAVLAFEVPHMLKHGGSGSSAPATTTATTAAGGDTTSPTVPPATTPSGTAAAAVAPTSSTKLPDSDTAPRRSKSQLYSFSHFAGKDPFVQQVSSGTSLSTPPTSTATPASSPTATTAASVQSAPPHHTVRTLAKTGTATISVNGKLDTVRIGGSFPSSNPLFKVVSITRGVARIGIANGSYQSGAQTVTLVTGRTLTLVDTADGIRYRLRLVTAS